MTAYREGDLREMLDWAITQTPVNIALLDTEMRQLRLNTSMCRTMGLDCEAAGLGLRLTDLLSTRTTEEMVTAARTVARTGKPAAWRGVNRLPGESRVHAVEMTLSPVRDPAGRVDGVLVVAIDTTEQHLARERLAIVNEASTRIGGTLDTTRTAEELVEVAVPRLADYAAVDVVDSVFQGDEPTSDPFEYAVPLRRMACGSVLDGCPEAMIRPGQVSCFPRHSPTAKGLTGGLLVSDSDMRCVIEHWAEQDPVRATYPVKYGFHSLMVVPMRARGATLGIVTFVRHRRPESFEDDDLVLAEEIVARAGSRVPVGGDWFDVIRLSGSRVGLVVGDVVGHGIHASATMGRLRTAVRTLADVDLEPADLLTRLDDVITRLADEEGMAPDGLGSADLSATCLYAVYDPVSRRCSVARAGHPPPAVVAPCGPPRLLDVPACPPLGLGGLPFEQTEVELPEDSLLVLYTDGLIESRHRDIDTGLTAMCKVLNDVRLRPDGPPYAASSLETICDTLVAAMLPEGGEDDAALLVARTRALPADRIVSWDLPAEPAVVACARAQAARQLAAWGLGEATDTTEQIVSELLTNAILHAKPPIELRLILDGALTCEVSDGSKAGPHLRCADPYDEDGRGLLLVARLTERWGTRRTRTGKTIWAQQPLPPGGS